MLQDPQPLGNPRSDRYQKTARTQDYAYPVSPTAKPPYRSYLFQRIHDRDWTRFTATEEHLEYPR